MKSLEKNKPVVVAIILFILALAGYNYFFAGSAVDIAAEPAAQTVGQSVLSLKTSLQSVSFDTSLFSSRLYGSLTDLSPTLSAPVVGRADPFAPIGR